jgi:hypothetical protein
MDAKPMTTERNFPEELLDEHEAANWLKVSVATLRRRRLLKQPPTYAKLGASVRYRPESIRRLIEEAEQHGGK